MKVESYAGARCWLGWVGAIPNMKEAGGTECIAENRLCASPSNRGH